MTKEQIIQKTVDAAIESWSSVCDSFSIDYAKYRLRLGYLNDDDFSIEDARAFQVKKKKPEEINDND